MSTDWTSAFDNVGIKTVTDTDKAKGAFVPNAEQKMVLSAAGFEPGEGGPNAERIIIEVLGDSGWDELDTSYYDSMRYGAGRTPETRMGRDFIHWAEVGDDIAIGNLGDQLYAWKVNAAVAPQLHEVASQIASTADEVDLLAKAREAKGKPAKQTKVISDFKRNLAVVAGALARSNGACEMPQCSTTLFQKADGQSFLEVHHVVPLGEGGDDTLVNAAGLCPMCHRELHYGAKRLEKRETLQKAIQAKEP